MLCDEASLCVINKVCDELNKKRQNRSENCSSSYVIAIKDSILSSGVDFIRFETPNVLVFKQLLVWWKICLGN